VDRRQAAGKVGPAITSIVAIVARLHRLAPAAVAAAALALAGTTLGYPVVASAEPQEWDIDTYDSCMKKTVRDADYCCVLSGGVAGRTEGTCTAPAAVAQNPAESTPRGGQRTITFPVPPQATFQAPQAPAANSG